MGRRAAVTPGTDPQPVEDEVLAPAVSMEGMSENDMLKARLEQQERDIADMRLTMKALARNQVATAAPEKVELPDMASVLKTNPKMPVLTKEGWFVPLVHPTDREKAL
jgi:hypothetical protein